MSIFTYSKDFKLHYLQAAAVHEMQYIAIDVTQRMVRVLGKWMSCAKMAEPTEMLYWGGELMWAQGTVLDRVQITMKGDKMAKRPPSKLLWTLFNI